MPCVRKRVVTRRSGGFRSIAGHPLRPAAFEEKSLAEYFQQRHLSSAWCLERSYVRCRSQVATAPVPVGYSEEGGWFKADGVDAYAARPI